jgi:hypothetical protein
MSELRDALDKLIEMDNKHQFKRALIIAIDAEGGVIPFAVPAMKQEEILWLVESFKLMVLGSVIKNQAAR